MSTDDETRTYYVPNSEPPYYREGMDLPDALDQDPVQRYRRLGSGRVRDIVTNKVLDERAADHVPRERFIDADDWFSVWKLYRAVEERDRRRSLLLLDAEGWVGKSMDAQAMNRDTDEAVLSMLRALYMQNREQHAELMAALTPHTSPKHA